MNLRRRRFFTLGAIIGTFPNQIVNGQLIDANPVMALFNFIQTQVNANAAPLSSVPTLTPIYVPPGNVGGTATALTLTPSPAIAAYQQGQNFVFQSQVTTGSAPGVTMNVSGLGAQPLVYKNGNALSGQEIQQNGVYQIYYGPGNKFYLMNSSQDTAIVPFTPAITFGGAAVGVTYSSQLGFYLKNGDVVFFSLSVVLTNKGSSTGAVAFTGLPFIINNSFFANNGFAFGYASCNNVTFGANSYVIASPNPGAATCTISQVPNAGAGPVGLTDTAFANNSGVGITGWYPV